jgi:hypothetical protein
MMRREIDVRDCPVVRMECVLNRRARAVEIKIPDERFLVRGTDDPVIAACKGRPLDICWRPLLPVGKVAWRSIWGV